MEKAPENTLHYRFDRCGQNRPFQWVSLGPVKLSFLNGFVVKNRKRFIKVVTDELYMKKWKIVFFQKTLLVNDWRYILTDALREGGVLFNNVNSM